MSSNEWDYEDLDGDFNFDEEDVDDENSLQDAIGGFNSDEDGVDDGNSLHDGIGDFNSDEEDFEDENSLHDEIGDFNSDEEDFEDENSLHDEIGDFNSDEEDFEDENSLHDGIGDFNPDEEDFEDENSLYYGIGDFNSDEDDVDDDNSICDGMSDFDSDEEDVADDSNFVDFVRNLLETPEHYRSTQTAPDLSSSSYANSPSSSLSSRSHMFGDFISSYLNLFGLSPKGQSVTSYSSKNAVDKDFKYISRPSPKVFVGNVPSTATDRQLTECFNTLGYPVRDIEIFKKSGKKEYAFIRFTSESIARKALHQYRKNNSHFMMNDQKLSIKRSIQSKSSLKILPVQTSLQDETGRKTSYRITDIHYGTLLTGDALRNIQRQKSTAVTEARWDVIAHGFKQFQHGINFRLQFDLQTTSRKFSIIGSETITVGNNLEISNSLKFEWNFRDLKRHRIIPVLVNQSFTDPEGPREMFFLIDIRRTPIILKEQNIRNRIVGDVDIETRLAATPMIAHADVWLIRLSADDSESECAELLRLLTDRNLIGRTFSYGKTLYNLSLADIKERKLLHVHMISNELWIEENQEKVDHFLTQRWPSYPFQTKFEMMKLISKHLITVNDLVVDENVDTILGLCSLNILTACTDKILEMGPDWNSDIHMDDEEDQNYSEDEVVIIDSTDSEETVGVEVQSSTGQTSRVGRDSVAPMIFYKSKIIPLEKQRNLGIFSRFLLSALNELHKKGELRQDKTSGMYVTKHELHFIESQWSLIYKIYITPSTILYEGPYNEEKCAVTRQFAQYRDRFLRLAFRDEDFRYLRNYNDNMKLIYEQIGNILKSGIHICDRKYEFLAFSSSQLHEHSCWMFSPINGVSATSIRQWMGEFDNVRPVAKYAARLGQLLSTTIKGIDSEPRNFKEMPDVWGYDDKGRKVFFTDGIGIISRDFAKKVFEKVGTPDSPCPSAFQIRCGGYKGMLCIDVANRIVDDEILVHFRPSMNKFSSTIHSIDVIRTSARSSSAYLNRQIILLLSSLGINDDIFLSLQKQMLEKTLLLTEDSSRACDSLRELNEFGGNGYHKFLIEFLQMFNNNEEPFTRRILRAYQTFLIKELRLKAKIFLPNSWSLLGVADESCKLRYGEVFIQITDQNHSGKTTIVTGPVIVTRNPCFHPGDIRRLQAVDIPDLHELKNIIVFPIQGTRPHPQEMSGGDLDGDTFWICQDERLIFNENDEPFDYKDQEVEQKQEEELNNVRITIDSVCEFFTQFIENDNLGVIAHSHLAIADKSPFKAKDSKCLDLARMHSKAVDFAKTGISVPKLTKEYRPESYPHYMEKSEKITHTSTNVLGKLFEDIKEQKIDLTINANEEIENGHRFPYKFMCVDGYLTFMDDAKSNKSEYERELKRIMRQYGIKHEAELVSGHILKLHSKQYSNETKLFDLRNEIAHAYRVVRDKYVRSFWREFYDIDDIDSEERFLTVKWNDISRKLTWHNQWTLGSFYNLSDDVIERVKQKASAWFTLTYEPWQKYLQTNQRTVDTVSKSAYFGLFSFAWVAYPVLFEIYKSDNEQMENLPITRRKRRRAGKRRNTLQQKKRPRTT